MRDQNAKSAEIRTLAESLLAVTDSSVVHNRLMADVLRVPEHDISLQAARRQLNSSCQVQTLLQEQHTDGSWGRFHSQDSRLKQNIRTTERGVERAVALGLGPWHPQIERTCDYLAALLTGMVDFPDPPEQNARWAAGVQLFTSSTLSRLVPQHQELKPVRDLWSEIAMRTFAEGTYFEKAEIQAHAELTGAPVKHSYLVIRNKYALNLLGSHAGKLSAKIEEALLAWLWSHPQGIGYLNIPLSAPPESYHPGEFERWFASLELLSKGFPAWVKFASASMAWLWDQRKEDELWDFGRRAVWSVELPFSDDWRVPRNREIDWSTRTLCLFSRYLRSLEQRTSTGQPYDNLEMT